MGLWDIITESWKEASEKVESEYREKNVVTPGVVLRDDRDFYDHYMVYAGRKTVIHFSDGVIKRQSLEQVKGRSWGYLDIMVFNSDVTKGISLAESLRRAESCLGMTGYDLFQNNCEHFALWCRTGKAFSSQAFGSTSHAFSLKDAAASGFMSLVNIPRGISEVYKRQVGMSAGQQISMEYMNDIQ